MYKHRELNPYVKALFQGDVNLSLSTVYKSVIKQGRLNALRNQSNSEQSFGLAMIIVSVYRVCYYGLY